MATKTQDKPLLTIREQRQLAQAASVAARAEGRCQEKEKDIEQIIHDRQACAAGMRFVAHYLPPAVTLPPDIEPVSAEVYRRTRRVAYAAFERDYLGTDARENGTDEARARLEAAWERYNASPLVNARILFVNVAALHYVEYFLGGPPTWARRGARHYETPNPTLPPADEDWDSGWFTLAYRVKSLAAREEYACEADVYYLKPLDLAGHATRGADDVPASVVPWHDVLGHRPVVALLGLPSGLGLKRTVRRIVGDWCSTGRRYTLPWVGPGVDDRGAIQ